MPVNENNTNSGPTPPIPPRPQRKRGRKTILSEEIIRILETSLISGNFVTTACAKAQIPTARFYEWMNKGRYYAENELDPPEEDAIYVELYDRIQWATASAEDALIKLYYNFARQDWRALDAFISKRWAPKWGTKKLEMQFNGGPLDFMLQTVGKRDPILQMQIEEELSKRFEGVDVAALLEEGTKPQGEE